MAFLESSLDRPVRRGKVRDVYDLGDRLLLVATDRISAYDWVLPTGIPDKGRVLTALSASWFHRLGVGPPPDLDRGRRRRPRPGRPKHAGPWKAG